MAKKKEKIEEEIEEIEDASEEVEEVVEDVKKSDEDEEEEFVELTTEERIVNIEKKTNLVLVLVAVTLVLALITMIVVINNGSSGSSSNENKTNTSESQESGDNSYDISAFKEIRAQDIASESKSETIVVMIGRQGCGYCAIYAPIITQVAEEYGITVRYIDFLKIVDLQSSSITDEEAYNTIKNLNATKEFEGAGEEALSGTPATLIIKNNKIINYIRGAADAATVEQEFKAAGLGK